MLKTTKKEVHFVDYYTLDDFVNVTFNCPDRFSVVSAEELGNDSDKVFTVDGKLDKWENEDFDKWLAGGSESYITGTVLNKLCQMGLVEPGEYLIEVCW